MTIYVDEAIHLYRGKWYCHMFTDQAEMDELHEFASRIGLKRSWFQNPHPGDHPHYDLAPSMRARALRLGARFKPGKEWIRDIVWPRRARLRRVQEVPPGNAPNP